MSTIREGGCQCGAIRYRLRGAPLDFYACHCRDCQKQSAAAFGLSLIIAAEAVQWSGETPRIWTTHGRSGAVKHCAFCGRCGTRLYHQGESPTQYSIKAGSLDDLAELTPHAHIWMRNAQPWIARLVEADDETPRWLGEPGE